MVYDIALWVGLVLLGIGIIHRIDAWFLRSVGTGDRSVPPGRRAAAGLAGIASTLFSGRVVGLLKALVVDVLFQGRILRDAGDRLAWVLHACLFWGFVLLLLFHALGTYAGPLIGPAYQSTVAPYLWLRDVAGLALVTGLVLAVVRRIVRKREIRTAAGDVTALAVLGVIALSGFLLQGLQVTSEREFDRMVTDYVGGLPDAEAAALKSYWVEHYGLVASHDPALASQGRDLDESYCQSCHAAPQTAFVSYAVSRALTPAAAALDRAGGVRGLWWIHVLACCAGLAYLAFGKMFHIFSTPVSVVVAEVSGPAQPAAVALTRQAIELDGCSHGGACHDGCPVKVRRLERIGATETYEPMLAYLGEKSPQDLGSRPVRG